jgi:CheY-like chemotaxis protein/nitrogen-specific signal transduction histidine kinase
MARLRSKKRSKKKSAAKPKRRRKTHRVPVAPAPEAALAAFAHDIRTSLTGILALGELLASSNLGERERRWAGDIKNSAEHLAALTTLVIDATRADAGAIVLQRQPFRPRRLIDDLSESLAVRAETKGLRSEVAIAGVLPEMVVGDAVRLRAAIENLIDNAVKFTERGTVKLEVRSASTSRDRAKFTFAITDTGIGLSGAELKRLFRPFRQANPEVARRYGGSGLGLVVVKALAKLMQGDLTVRSNPGRGSRFQFSCVTPIASNDLVSDAHSQQTRVSPRALAVLCAEDNPYGRVIINTILTELGHRADFVGTGEEAVEAVARGYDVVLMDVKLPGIDGLETTRRIRALAGPHAATSIIGISGRTEPGDEADARSAGMNAYLRKPISPSALAEAFEAAKRR